MTRGTEAQEGKTEQAAEGKPRRNEGAPAAPSELWLNKGSAKRGM